MNPSLLPQNPLLAPQGLDKKIQISPYNLQTFHNPLLFPIGILSSRHDGQGVCPQTCQAAAASRLCPHMFSALKDQAHSPCLPHP